jgi:hypothetical protein
MKNHHFGPFGYLKPHDITTNLGFLRSNRSLFPSPETIRNHPKPALSSAAEDFSTFASTFAAIRVYTGGLYVASSKVGKHMAM